MSLTFTATRQVTITGGKAYPASVDMTAGGGVIVDELVPAGENKDIACTIDQSQMSLFFLSVSAACTVTAKLTDATVNTFVMLPGQAILWELAGGGAAARTACPLSGDINKLAITNTPDVTVTCVALIDPTV
jgi:hypothetical protein